MDAMAMAEQSDNFHCLVALLAPVMQTLLLPSQLKPTPAALAVTQHPTREVGRSAPQTPTMGTATTTFQRWVRAMHLRLLSGGCCSRLSPSAPNLSPGVASSGTADPLSSPDGCPAPSTGKSPHPPQVPSSQLLGFCKKTVTMRKIAKKGKTRPWLFGQSTAEGYDIYTSVECPSPGCKHQFSSQPLMSGRAEEHIRNCLGLPGEDQDIIRDYASQGRLFSGHLNSLLSCPLSDNMANGISTQQ